MNSVIFDRVPDEDLRVTDQKDGVLLHFREAAI